MKKKILITLVLVITCLTNVFAFSDTNIIDFRADESNYTASQASKITLPFVRMTSKKIVMDTDTNKSGVLFSASNVEISSKLSGVYFVTAGEEVVIKGEMQNVIVSAPNVRVEGKINGLLINLSENLEIAEKAEVNEVCTYSKNLIVNGKVKENLLGSVNKFTLKGNVDKDVRLKVEQLDIDANKIKGEVFFKTYNKNLNAKYVYPNAKVEVNELEKEKEENLVVIGNIAVAVLTASILYYLFEELGKKKIVSKFENKVTNNFGFVMLVSLTTFILVMPIMFLAILLMTVGFTNIAIAILALYIGLFIATISMSLTITGGYIAKYITNKLKARSKAIEYLIVMAVYAILYIATEFAFTFAAICAMFAFGAVITYLFKKNSEIK